MGLNENPDQNNVLISPYKVSNVSKECECSKRCLCVSLEPFNNLRTP